MFVVSPPDKGKNCQSANQDSTNEENRPSFTNMDLSGHCSNPLRKCSGGPPSLGESAFHLDCKCAIFGNFRRSFHRCVELIADSRGICKAIRGAPYSHRSASGRWRACSDELVLYRPVHHRGIPQPPAAGRTPPRFHCSPQAPPKTPPRCSRVYRVRFIRVSSTGKNSWQS